MMSAIDEHYSHRWELNTNKPSALFTDSHRETLRPQTHSRYSSTSPPLATDSTTQPTRFHFLILHLHCALSHNQHSLHCIVLMLHEGPSTSMNLSIAQKSLYSGKRFFRLLKLFVTLRKHGYFRNWSLKAWFLHFCHRWSLISWGHLISGSIAT